MLIRQKNAIKTLLSLGLFVAAQASYAQEVALSPVKVDQVIAMPLAANAELMGTLHSRAHIQVTAGVNGRLEWLAEPGSFVQAGENLVKMDLLPLKLMQLEQKAQIKRAEINLQYLANELQRLKKLTLSNSTSQFQLDQNQSRYDLAQTDIEIADLKLKQIEDQIARATVKAPFDGVITERLVRAGTDVNRSDGLLKILDTEHLEVRLYVPIKYRPYVSKGKGLNISANGQLINAAITSLIPSVDAKSQTFEVRINIPNEFNDTWAAGQLVQVSVPTQTSKASLTVHRDALILRKEGTFVVKVDRENKVHRLPVVVGNGSYDRVSIEGEIQSGDYVAIRGAERLAEGQTVIVQ